MEKSKLKKLVAAIKPSMTPVGPMHGADRSVVILVVVVVVLLLLVPPLACSLDRR